MFKVAILTASDTGARGEREDKSGRVIKDTIIQLGGNVVDYAVVPDDLNSISEKLMYFVNEVKVNLILTTGGTGLCPRDNTPEATLAVIEKQVPGMAETMRAECLKKTPHAMLSRAVCGVKESTLIINLPGGPKAVKECMEVIKPALFHALELLKGQVSDCSRRST